MRTGISITITRSVRGRLEAITRDRNASQKHAWRAAIILLSADGVGTNEIMRRTGKSKTCVWRWQERFMKEGIDGLLHDKTRPSRIPPLGPEVAARVVALTLADPPVETTHWTADLMARASGMSASAVRRIWKARSATRPAATTAPSSIIACPGCSMRWRLLAVTAAMRMRRRFPLRGPKTGTPPSRRA